jgi:hypothetical protein
VGKKKLEGRVLGGSDHAGLKGHCLQVQRRRPPPLPTSEASLGPPPWEARSDWTTYLSSLPFPLGATPRPNSQADAGSRKVSG